ncbi:sodium-coupled monocarboxylate transporter 1-like [Agrilus planipennis]|uniref:Sodium-coupled monocarboxylate transporter 1-like n=1 Tax=Agrilus planipennis TaxID=224129 RepID=A0A1W4X8M1_AGRPL|nr:sodium-coupled monocarboxylate transporter 1-like [Agrilus planipennis]
MESTTVLSTPLTNFSIAANGPNDLRFSWIDYSFFTILLSFSTLVGIYHGCFGNKQATTVDYLHAGKTMNFFPVAISQIASHLSGVTLLGIPAEMYTHGTQYWSSVFTSAPLTVLVAIYVTLPVFYKLQLTSCYEYLTMRFDARLTKITSILYLIGILSHLPIVVYVPALAFNQVSGLSMYLTTPIVCMVCIFYTTVGGLKAVIWSDALQFTVTFATLAVIFVLGTSSVGGFAQIWNIASENNRIEFFNMNLDPTIRTTFWTIAIGNSIPWINNNAFSPISMQKYMAVPKYSHAVKVIIIFGIGTIITKSLSCFSGLMIFAKYHDCDPFQSKKIIKNDQLLPYFIMDVAGNIPGVAGLFIAGVFSTALSTMASGLNTTAGTIYKNFIANWLPKDTSEKTASNIMKMIVIVTGLICSGLVFIVDKLGAVLQVSMSFHGLTTGTHMGIFLLGMFFPSANATGAFWGSVASLTLTAILVFGAQVYTYQGKMKIPTLPASVEGCNPPLNVTNFSNQTVTQAVASGGDQVFWLFRISFYYYPLIGVILCIVLGLIISHFTKDEKEKIVDADLFNPYILRFISRKHFSTTPVKYASAEKAFQMTEVQENVKCTPENK